MVNRNAYMKQLFYRKEGGEGEGGGWILQFCGAVSMLSVPLCFDSFHL